MVLHPPYVVIKQKKTVRDIILDTAILHGLSIAQRGSGPGLQLGAATEQCFGLLLKHGSPEQKHGHKCLGAWASAR